MVTAEAVQKLIIYRNLLLQWNQKFNLISRSDEAHILSKHCLDAVCLLECVSFNPNSAVLDLGTGAGFPGLPMAILRPDLKMILVEARRKKVLFLKHVVNEMALNSIQIVLGRFETVAESFTSVPTIVTRAVGDMLTLLQWSALVFQAGRGRLIAMKGEDVQNEIEAVAPYTDRFGISGIESIPLYPGGLIRVGSQSTVVIVSLNKKG